MPRDANKLEENKDYELVPGDDNNWAIRFLNGEFIETVIAYGNTKIDGTDDDPVLSFDFGVVSSPIEEIDPENIALQDAAGDVLYSILCNAIDDGSIETREPK